MKRLFEEPQLPAELREDLQRSRAAGQDYPTNVRLPQLRAALRDAARDPLAERAQSAVARTWRAVHPGWKLAALLVLGGTTVPVLWPDAGEVSTSRVPAATSPESASQRAVVVPPTAAETEATPASAPAPPQHEQVQSSRREIAQLVRVRALLQQDPHAAYRLAQQSEREFPNGLLSEERQALSIVALQRTGRHDAAAAAAKAFFARYPESPMRELIKAALP